LHAQQYMNFCRLQKLEPNFALAICLILSRFGCTKNLHNYFSKREILFQKSV
jgi:hypothetical protein